MSSRAMLARRPDSEEEAFGHVDMSESARNQLLDMVEDRLNRTLTNNEIPYDPDDLAGDGEVLVEDLDGVDEWFQADAPWSLTRAVAEIRTNSLPDVLNADEIRSGSWSFYVVQADIDGQDVIAIRGRSPTWGLKDKLMTRFVGTELKPVTQPLVAFDDSFEVLVVDSKVYFLRPRQAEKLFIDADVIKERAPASVASFRSGIDASLSDEAEAAIVRVCEHNSNVARRVERLNRDTDLAVITTDDLREGLTDAGLLPDTFGTGDEIEAHSDLVATALVDIAADLYYQPRFAEKSRRVAAYRNVSSQAGG